MKTIAKLMCLLAIASTAGCSKEATDAYQEDLSDSNSVGHEMIVLGRKLDDPYSVENMTRAVSNLYPTKAGRIDITPTDVYVRFLPQDEGEYKTLESLGFDLIDHPLDYQIIKDGDYYRDPAISDDEITWQYAVVPHGTSLPADIEHEVLDNCFIPRAGTRSGDGIDWDAVEAESFRITGNSNLLQPGTRGVSGYPEGRITIVDKNANGGKAFGLAGVKVVCNTFVKFSSAYTDRDGYYKIDREFTSNPRYRLMFTNKEKFSIGFNLILIPASMSALGTGPASGIDVEITESSERKLWCRSVVNNAAYDYIMRCGEEDMNILRPPKGLRIWLFQKMRASSAVMMKQGAFIENSLIKSFLGEYSALIRLFLPDITLGLKDKGDYSRIYSLTCHELAHASHFAKVGKDYWDNYIFYIISSFVSSGGETYGNGTGKGAGYCEVGEMWGYYMQNALFHDRYGGTMPIAGTSYWFRPQIFRYLEERGLSRSEIFASLTDETIDRNSLKAKLLELYPTKSSIILEVFERYAQ